MHFHFRFAIFHLLATDAILVLRPLPHHNLFAVPSILTAPFPYLTGLSFHFFISFVWFAFLSLFTISIFLALAFCMVDNLLLVELLREPCEVFEIESSGINSSFPLAKLNAILKTDTTLFVLVISCIVMLLSIKEQFYAVFFFFFLPASIYCRCPTPSGTSLKVA